MIYYIAVSKSMSDGVEVLVLHGFTRQNTGSSAVDEHETEQVDGIWLAEFLVLGVDESVPPLLRVPRVYSSAYVPRMLLYCASRVRLYFLMY